MRHRRTADPSEWKRTTFLRALRLSQHFSARDAATILTFTDWLLRLRLELDNQLKERLNESMKEAGMEWTGGIHGQIRVLALQEGREEGREEGLKFARNMLTTLLRDRFGELPSQILDRIEKATFQLIEQWTARLKTARSPIEVFD